MCSLIILFYCFCFVLFFYLAKKKEKKKVLGNKIQTHQYELVFIFMEINIKKNTICLLYFDIIPVPAFICKAVYVTCGNWGET